MDSKSFNWKRVYSSFEGRRNKSFKKLLKSKVSECIFWCSWEYLLFGSSWKNHFNLNSDLISIKVQARNLLKQCFLLPICPQANLFRRLLICLTGKATTKTSSPRHTNESLNVLFPFLKREPKLKKYYYYYQNFYEIYFLSAQKTLKKETGFAWNS